jgi:hypothetical protein
VPRTAWIKHTLRLAGGAVALDGTYQTLTIARSDGALARYVIVGGEACELVPPPDDFRREAEATLRERGRRHGLRTPPRPSEFARKAWDAWLEEQRREDAAHPWYLDDEERELYR